MNTKERDKIRNDSKEMESGLNLCVSG